MAEDPESPFSLSSRGSCTRRSLNTNSKGEISSSASKLKDVRHPGMFNKYSIPSLALLSKKDSFTSTFVDVKKTPTLSNRLRGASVGLISNALPFSFDKNKSQSSSDWTAGDKSATIVPFPSASSPTSSHLFPPSPTSSSTHSAPLKTVPPSPLLSAWARGHKKSHSLGSKYVILCTR